MIDEEKLTTLGTASAPGRPNRPVIRRAACMKAQHYEPTDEHNKDINES